jgi:pyroglutamyl-peptidase
MKRVLLTGFVPFDGHKTNPSQQIVERLSGETIAGAKVSSLVLPVIFGEDVRHALPAIEEMKPALVLSLGLAAGIACLNVEMFAINHRKTDNPGELAPIIADGPAAYFATIDPGRVAGAISSETGAPASPHGYAGSYLCNHIFYHCLHYAATKQPGLPVGFIHLPFSTEQRADHPADGTPGLPLDLMTAGIRAAIQEALV